MPAFKHGSRIPLPSKPPQTNKKYKVAFSFFALAKAYHNNGIAGLIQSSLERMAKVPPPPAPVEETPVAPVAPPLTQLKAEVARKAAMQKAINRWVRPHYSRVG